MLRDRVKKLIAFHADPPRLMMGLDERPRALEDFTIPEDDFKAIFVPEEKN